MVVADWTPFVAPAALLLNVVIIPWAIVAYQRRTGVQLTDQQRAAVSGALTTAAGLLETLIDQGSLRVSDITPDNREIMVAARTALARVPDAAAKVGISPFTAAAIVVARVNTSPRPPAIAPPTVA